MSAPRPTQPIHFFSYASELLEMRARSDEQQAGQLQAEQNVASLDDAFDQLHRHVVRPLREHLPALARRNTAQLLREGFDPSALRELPPDVLREAAQWAVASNDRSVLGNDLLIAEQDGLLAHERLAQGLHAVMADVASKLLRAQRTVHAEISQMEAAGLLGDDDEVPAMAAQHELAVAQLARLERLLPMVEKALASDARSSHQTERFFLSALDAVTHASNRFSQATTQADKERIADHLLHLLQKPLRLL